MDGDALETRLNDEGSWDEGWNGGPLKQRVKDFRQYEIDNPTGIRSR
jgi:hypothetical protein